MKLFFAACFSFFLTFLLTADPYPRNGALDVLKYAFRLELNDTTNRLSGEATITILFKNSIADFDLDLINKGTDGFGMMVDHVLLENRQLKFSHQKNRLRITLSTPANPGQPKTFVIQYAGIPADGLIIGKTKYGDRSFFGDNWPDRGRHWLPCIDHPSDKASVDFIIVAPQKYQVIASGRKIEETNLPRDQKLTHWEERVPIPVKVMTIGVTRFAVDLSAVVDHVPQSIWVYPQNRDEGFNDFAVGTKIFGFFHQHIGPYAYEKLAHVQSRTRWGGLENASNIFYMESSVTGKNQHEGLIAHETAHQWFGNSVTEDDWHHVWLSEGFATYFTALYFEHAYGRDKLVQEMKKDRDEVVDFVKKNRRPIIDTTILDISQVLSTNTYQKAGWVLHMLRRDMGDESFWKGIRQYYSIFRDSNAMTSDFRKIMEQASGKDLRPFFNQWLYQGGHPQLKVSWRYDQAAKKVSLFIDQVQKEQLHFSLEALLRFPNGTTELRTISIGSRQKEYSVPSEQKPLEVILDPNCWLLFEAEMKER